MGVWSACVPVHHIHVVPKEARRGHQIHACNWTCRCLWASMWVLGIDPKFSGRAASVLNYWGSPVPCCFLTQHRTTSPQWTEPSHINYQSRQCAPGVPTGQCDVGVFKLRVLSSQMALPCVKLTLKTSSPEEPKEDYCLSKRERGTTEDCCLQERSQQKTPPFSGRQRGNYTR